jgi:cellulose synthase/poly-beta-1,6-N-acetylglucosamine synthase-like glycosyltransferase
MYISVGEPFQRAEPVSKCEMKVESRGESQPRRSQPIAVLMPCFNEEATIAKAVDDFRVALPEATVYVYDNNSTDRTIDVARAAGAAVRREMRRGKGNVIRRMFADVEADIYVLVDGGATYDAASARVMIARLIEDDLDAVVAARVAAEAAAYRPGHRMGNWLLTSFFAAMFNATFTDVLSGYQVFSRRFVKSFPVLSSGFEIEVELSAHALGLDLAVGEVPTPYYGRKDRHPSLAPGGMGCESWPRSSGSTIRSGRSAFSP